jgi:hypothetical protein
MNENQNLAPNFGMNISHKLSFRQIDEKEDDDCVSIIGANYKNT